MRTSALATVLFLASSAAAEPAGPAGPPDAAKSYELGARVGGYGFRRDGNQPWTECRMHGFGIFGDRKLRGPLVVEAGLDLYSSAGPTEPMDLPIDRTSGLASVALGARTRIAWWLRGYLQLGGGVELARVSVPYGDKKITDTKAMPEGFFGAGLDLRLWRGTYFGTSFRALVMGNFDYDPARLDPNNSWVAAPTADKVFDASPDVAAQIQFSLRHEL